MQFFIFRKLRGKQGEVRATKIINNNAAYSTDELGREIIVVGKGVAFQKKTGDELDRNIIEKIFRFTPKSNSRFSQLVTEIPFEYIQLAEKIIEYAQVTLNRHLNKNIYITLTDHLNFAIERHQKGIEFQNALLWEIQRFYPAEYDVGVKALELVKEETGIELSIDEAGFFALHVVNAEMNGKMEEPVNAPVAIKGLINIVRYHFQLNINEESLSYERFLTHVKFLLQRIIQNKCFKTEDEEFNRSVFERYPEAYECACKMGVYIRQTLGYELSQEEITFLTVHVERVVHHSVD